MLQFLKAHGLILFVVEVLEHAFALFMTELYPFVFSLQKLDELILLKLSTAIRIALVH